MTQVLLEQLFYAAMGILAAAFVMIIHESMKALIYFCIYGNIHKARLKSILRLYRYIDPIGLIFAAAAYAGFSKPYPYGIINKKSSFFIGTVGFLSLLFVFFTSLLLLGTMSFPMELALVGRKGALSVSQTVRVLLMGVPYFFCFFTCVSSLGMFVANLFPIASFDMGMVIAGKSTEKYKSILINDYLIKVIFILTIVIRLTPVLIVRIFSFFASGGM